VRNVNIVRDGEERATSSIPLVELVEFDPVSNGEGGGGGRERLGTGITLIDDEGC